MPRNTCIYKIAGTDTFRLASSAITMNFISGDERGTNMQNQPHNLRKMYEADEGKILCQVDQAGAEALIVAYLCRPGKFRALFDNYIKPHTFVAMNVFQKELQQELDKQSMDIRIDLDELVNLQIEELSRHPFWKPAEKLIKKSDEWPAERRYYYMGKQICHSSNYGIRPFRFSMNVLQKSKGRIVIPTKRAEEYLSVYHSLFPEIREWHRITNRILEQSHVLYNLQGFPREFNSLFENENDFKEAYSYVPQSTVGTITNVALTQHQELIEEHHLKHDILQNNHDSYCVQCPIGEELECCKLMSSLMNQELISPSGEKFRMRSEAKAGYNWSEFDSEHNPRGLKELQLI